MTEFTARVDAFFDEYFALEPTDATGAGNHAHDGRWPDVSATGRQAQPCRQCHFDPWYALDGLAKTLTRVHYDKAGNATFTAPTDGPQQILGGLTINNDKELVNALIGNDAFNFNVCRTAFKFLYGRAENKCEGPIFDKCMQAFKADGMVQSALKAVAKDPSFCQ